MALFRGSVVRVWDHRRLMVPVQWAQRLQVVRVEQRAGLVLVVRPALTGQRLQQGRRLLVDPDDAIVAGWRPDAPCSARLVGCGDCVLIAAHVDPRRAQADEVLSMLDAIAELAPACPLPAPLLVDAVLQRLL